MISENAIKAVFERSLRLKADESCLVVTDTEKESIGRAFYEYALKITPDAAIIVMDPTEEHAAEPPEHVAEEMKSHIVQLYITHKSLTHTNARIAATSTGARIASMPMITEDIANRCLDIDYEALRDESMRMHDILSKAETIRVTTDAGTDVSFTVGDSGFFGKEGGIFDQPGAYGNLPEGEIAFAPALAEGVYVIDASFPEFGLLRSPLTFKVAGGAVTGISGERSEEVIARLDKVGPKAYRVAELGIGLNPKAKVIGNILEDEKVIGTVHIALGNNLSFGGDNDVPLHLDGVINRPDIFIDGEPLMLKGRFI